MNSMDLFSENYPYQTSYCSFKFSQFILDKIFKNFLETHMPYHVAMLKKINFFTWYWVKKQRIFHILSGPLDPCDLNIKIDRGHLQHVLCGSLTDQLTVSCAKMYHLLFKRHTKIKVSTLPERFCTNHQL